MSTGDEIGAFDFHGALVVVETPDGGIVLVHPPGGPAESPASLPSDFAPPEEPPEKTGIRVVRELTGLEVEITEEIVTFIQEGTPAGTMCAHGYVARVIGGSLTDDGSDGPARAYPMSALPGIMPIRVANQRVLAAYLERRGTGEPLSASHRR